MLARGFQHGTQPGALVIGWNSYHTAVTLPNGTPVASGERGGVRIGGKGAYQPQFTHHMYLPIPQEALEGDPPAGEVPAPVDAPPAVDAPPPVDAPPVDAPAPPVEEPAVVVDAPGPPGEHQEQVT